ncbi:MAG: hypothetical protein WEC16_01880 [Anaerolineales bacterium]
MPTATAQKEEDRRKGFIIIIALIALALLLWLASTLGWLQAAPSAFATGAGGSGASAGGGAGGAGGGGGGGGPVVGVGPSGEIQVVVSGSASTDNSGCLLGFICANASIRAEGNRTDATIDDDGVEVDSEN